MNKCLVTACDRPPHNARGLCEACYKFARQLVIQGRTTWKQLEDDGKCLRKRRRESNEIERFFLPTKLIAALEERQLLLAIAKTKEDPISSEAQDHVRGIILDHIRELMDGYGLTTTNTIGRLIAALESTMQRWKWWKGDEK